MNSPRIRHSESQCQSLPAARKLKTIIDYPHAPIKVASRLVVSLKPPVVFPDMRGSSRNAPQDAKREQRLAGGNGRDLHALACGRSRVSSDGLNAQCGLNLSVGRGRHRLSTSRLDTTRLQSDHCTVTTKNKHYTDPQDDPGSQQCTKDDTNHTDLKQHEDDKKRRLRLVKFVNYSATHALLAKFGYGSTYRLSKSGFHETSKS
jgi:hypothetical protein